MAEDQFDFEEQKKIIIWNRKHNEFITDNGCLGCDYSPMCIDKCGDDDFSCPLDDTKSSIYANFVVKNYGSLCEVIKQPSEEEWKKVAKKESKYSKVYAMDSLKCQVRMPRTPLLDKFIDKYSIMETERECLCEFSMLNFHKRIRLMLLYNHKGDTDSSVIAKQLIELLVPNEYKELFTFEGNK